MIKSEVLRSRISKMDKDFIVQYMKDNDFKSESEAIRHILLQFRLSMIAEK